MEEHTYDPVLAIEELPKWRLTNPLRPPDPGRALVLVRDSGPSLTIRSGEEIPSSRFGVYRSVFTVDLAEHRLVLDIPLLSRDPTFSFRSRVELVCRVADPAKVVSRGIRDMSGALYGFLRKTLRAVARDYDIAQFHEAEQALGAALSGFTGDDAIRLRGIQVELLVDEDEIAASGREFRDVVRETRLAGMRRERHLGMIREDGVDGLIAEIMEREGPRAALAWIEKGEAEKREVRREVMRMVLERGDADREPFEQTELERAVLEEVLRDGDGVFGTAARRGRLSGSLSRALDPASRDDAPVSGEDSSRRAPLRGEVVHHEPRTADDGRGPTPHDRAGRHDPRRGTSRVAGAGSTPPGDEPLPTPGSSHSSPTAESDTVERAPHRPPAGDGNAERHSPYPGSGDTPDRPTAPAPRVSRVRGTAKRTHGGTEGERR
ncbi:hypothetical protein [Streptomyces sp. NPDC021096]|uniref:hypothetical protein n=1 Tax=Streptomyces sp. NPDC021096 TaxID=3154792 RepID=UPI0034016E3A